jgi:hypothetical protein
MTANPSVKRTVTGLPLTSNVRTHMTPRPVHIWLVLALVAAFTLWLLYAIAVAAMYFVAGGHSLRLMAAYIPALLGACVCALAGIALFLHKPWVRWLFLLPVAAAAFQLLALMPYALLAHRPIADPAAKASIFYMLGGFLQPLIFFLVAIGVAIPVFRYLRVTKTSPVATVGEPVSPNPSIERTTQRQLRALWPTAHVER